MRDLSPEAIAALNGPTVALVILVEMLLSQPVRLSTAAHAIDWDGKTFQGAGALGSVDTVQDATGEPKSIKFVISGVPTELLSLAMSEAIRNKPVTMWLGVLDPVTHAVLDAPTLWTGTLDQMPISVGQGTSTIAVTSEHRGVTFARPKPLRYTDGDQQRLHPGDTSLRFVLSQSGAKDVWPAAGFLKQ